nr:P1 family peptidase [Pseudomonas caricapapayae]
MERLHISPLFAAAAEAVEEAIVNVLVAGRTMVSVDGRAIPGLDGSTLLQALEATGWRSQKN